MDQEELPEISPELKEKIDKESHKGLSLNHIRLLIHEVIFGVETRWGRVFDVMLLWAIVISLVAIMLESVGTIREEYGTALSIVEWVFTIFFTVEYILRLWVSETPKKYAFSFLGVVDLLAIIPTYLSLFVVGSQCLLVRRAIRLLRVFRILKLVRYLKGAQLLVTAMRASMEKIFVFVSAVLTTVVILGTLMYMIEGGENGFDSIPRSIYWAIVTLTTVGYGDIAPGTTLGQFLAAFIMIMGYGMIAVPTGIVGVEVAKASNDQTITHANCNRCGESDHLSEARYCHRCGEEMKAERPNSSEPPND